MSSHATLQLEWAGALEDGVSAVSTSGSTGSDSSATEVSIWAPRVWRQHAPGAGFCHLPLPWLCPTAPSLPRLPVHQCALEIGSRGGEEREERSSPGSWPDGKAGVRAGQGQRKAQG